MLIVGRWEMFDERILIDKAKVHYEKNYFLMEKDFMKMVKESKVKIPNLKVAIEDFQRGYEQGLVKGKEEAFRMKENADGCVGCAFEDRNSWEMPCDKCSRNSKDYWRAKKV